MSQSQGHLEKSWKELLLGWNKNIYSLVTTVASIATLLISVKNNFWDKPQKNEFQTTLDSMKEEARERGRAEERAKNFAEMSSKHEKKANECEEEKLRIFNESQQRREIISWHDFTEEEGQILNKDILSSDWEKNQEVKRKRDEVRFKQHKCRNCPNCNS